MAMLTSPLTIIQLALDDIQGYTQNPREHPKKQLAMLAKSIRRYGFNNPVLVTRLHELIAGHARVEAARACGLTSVPAIVLPHLSEAEQRAYRIADNAIQLKGKWSMDLLRKEVEFLLDDEFVFDSDEIGLETGEVDFLLADGPTDEGSPQAVYPPRRNHPAICKSGDVWECAGHRIICADALDQRSYAALMGDELAAAILTDMPWNRRVAGEIGGLGRVHHPEFAMASGEMSSDEFSDFMRQAFRHQASFSRRGAVCMNFIDWRSVADMIKVGESVFAEDLLNLCVWVKQSGGMGSLWRSRHELVCVFKSGTEKHVNNVMLGKWGRYRTNVWEYAAPSAFGSERSNLEFHPTSKNVDMLAEAIMDVTDRGDLVLDQFLGSGATLLAAHKVGRIGRGIEIDEHYVDVCLERLIELTSADAINQSGESFTALRSAAQDSQA